MKVACSKGRYALFMTVVMSAAITACSGDDDMGTGNGGMGGVAGSGGTAIVDSGKDVRVDASPDGSGGSGGLSEAGDGASEATNGGASGTGGGGTAGEAGPDANPNRDASPDTVVVPDSGRDVVVDVPIVSDVRDAGTDLRDVVAVDQDAAIPPDTSDATPLPGADADAPAQIPPDGAHAVCTAPGGTSLFLFDSAAEADGWQFEMGTMLGGGDYPPPANTPEPSWNADDGCPGVGQLRFTIPFDSLAGSIGEGDAAHPQGVHFTYDLSNPPRDWTNNTVIHIKLKVEAAAGLEFIQPYLDLSFPAGGPPVMNPDGSNEYTAAILGVGTWRELLINLPRVDAGSLVPSRLGFELYSRQPGTVSFVIDSVWIE